MKILVTGSSGLIGSAALPALRSLGHSVIGLRRGIGGGASWDPVTGEVDGAALENADAVIHLAGAGIAERRWTQARKRLIADSRSGPTKALSSTLAKSASPPRTLIVASAIGIYGNRGDEWLEETATPGIGFLSGVVQAWEAATSPAVERGIRVVNLRFGIILTPEGGALRKMLTPFRLGVGGPIGDGRQYWSWVGIEDVVGAMQYALDTPTLCGPVNVVSPNPVTNWEFTKTLARVLSRPAFIPLPRYVARLALGEMADELLLFSARVRPQKLKDSGYKFHHNRLDECLLALLHR